MELRSVWLEDFRSYERAEVGLAPGLTAVVGDNGTGKTNLLEAIGYLATLSSFRGVGREALVRHGAAQAVVRGEAVRAGRRLSVETEITRSGRGRTRLNGQPVRRSSDLDESLVVSVFSPDDLELVKGGPAGRRRYLDDLLVALHPRQEKLRRDLDRVLRQRASLLAQAQGRLSPALASTLDVWDAKLVEVGEALAGARAELVAMLEPAVGKAYGHVAGEGATVEVGYDAPWRAQGLAAALAAARGDDLRRAVTTVGPHHDELALSLGGLPARTCASQGEQRSLALALRLAAHAVVTDALGEAPVLLLDDVFSELDEARSRALLAHLPPGQAVLTTTGALPGVSAPDRVLRLVSGQLVDAGR